jgi:hypothetical protein
MASVVVVNTFYPNCVVYWEFFEVEKKIRFEFFLAKVTL